MLVSKGIYVYDGSDTVLKYIPTMKLKLTQAAGSDCVQSFVSSKKAMNAENKVKKKQRPVARGRRGGGVRY